MTGRALLHGEQAVLGLLALRPMHGYEMARYFDRDDLSEVVPIEQSLLYTYLRNLEDRGYVRWTEERVGQRPPRKTFHLTSEGRREVEGWLGATVDRMREVRVEFLVKLYVLHQLDPAAERGLLGRQVDVCDAYCERLRERLTDAEGFEELVVRSKLSAGEATAAWLRDYLESLVPGSTYA